MVQIDKDSLLNRTNRSIFRPINLNQIGNVKRNVILTHCVCEKRFLVSNYEQL